MNDSATNETVLNVGKRSTTRLCGVAFFMLCAAAPALANQPPGPGVAVPQILMLPIMALLTAIGGGYAILRAKKRPTSLRGARWIAIPIIFIMGFMHEGYSLLVTLAFGLLALTRGVRMIRWGAESARPEVAAPSPQAAASPEQAATQPSSPQRRPARWRLISAGALLSLVAVYLMGSALAFVNYWPDIYQYSQVSYMKSLVAAEIAYSRLQKQQSGEARFHRIKPGEQGLWSYAEPLMRHGNARMEFSADDKHFTIYLLPYSGFPPWPYRFWTTQGSYRADESGEIRMVRVRERDRLCPQDAAVVMKVEESDIEDATKNLAPAQQPSQ
jgi:hypothetical protein